MEVPEIMCSSLFYEHKLCQCWTSVCNLPGSFAEMSSLMHVCRACRSSIWLWVVWFHCGWSSRLSRLGMFLQNCCNASGGQRGKCFITQSSRINSPTTCVSCPWLLLAAFSSSVSSSFWGNLFEEKIETKTLLLHRSVWEIKAMRYYPSWKLQ